MYSFAQRDDVRVVDEPLYGHYLRVSGAPHPGREEVLATMNCEGDSIIRDLLAEQAQDNATRLFLKNMAHHLVELDLAFLNQTSNVILVRDPREMLPSLSIQLPQAGLGDTGLERQWQLYADLAAAGAAPAVLDSRELLLDPQSVLSQLCAHLGLEFDSRMLHWTAGARAEDGVWEPHWYHSVHRSTGFAHYEPKGEFPSRLETLLAECQPWYDKLIAHAIRGEQSGD